MMLGHDSTTRLLKILGTLTLIAFICISIFTFLSKTIFKLKQSINANTEPAGIIIPVLFLYQEGTPYLEVRTWIPSF